MVDDVMHGELEVARGDGMSLSLYVSIRLR